MMYKNKARFEHEARSILQDPDQHTPFDMNSVVIPTLARRPHAVSAAYRSQVRASAHFSHAVSWTWVYAVLTHLSSLDMIRGA